VPPTPRPSSVPHPLKGDSDALEECTTTNPATVQDVTVTQGERSTFPSSPPTMCGHLGRYGPISGVVEPSPTLWGSVLMECHHAESCTARAPSSARPSNWHTGFNQAHALGELPTKQLPSECRVAMTSAWTMIRQDAIRSPTLYISTTILCKNPRGMPMSRLPLVYKRRRRTPSRTGGGEMVLIRILLHTITPLNWHSPQSPSQDLEAFPPLPSRL
jgi:hypothetical protein